MDEPLSAQDKIALIKSYLQEVLKPEIIEDVIVKQNRPLRVYWGIFAHGTVQNKLVYLRRLFALQARRRQEDHTAAISFQFSRLLTSSVQDV